MLTSAAIPTRTPQLVTSKPPIRNRTGYTSSLRTGDSHDLCGGRLEVRSENQMSYAVAPSSSR
jgi:hypothetical protein